MDKYHKINAIDENALTYNFSSLQHRHRQNRSLNPFPILLLIIPYITGFIQLFEYPIRSVAKWKSFETEFGA